METEAKEPALFISPGEAAELLGLSAKTVVKYCRTGRLPARKVCGSVGRRGGKWRLSREKLLESMNMERPARRRERMA